MPDKDDFESLFSSEEFGDLVDMHLDEFDAAIYHLIVESKHKEANRETMRSIIHIAARTKNPTIPTRNLVKNHRKKSYKVQFYRLLKSLEELDLLKYKKGYITINKMPEWRRVFLFMKRYPQ